MTVVSETQGRTRLRRARLRWTIGLLAVFVVIVGIVIWRVVAGPKPKPQATAPTPVNSAPVKVGDIDVYLDALGTVTPVYTATIVSRVAGEITEVHFREGQIVRKNDLLAVIDPRPYAAVLLQGQGQLARDEAALKNARLDLVRYQNSYKEHAIPQQELATQQATVDQDEGTVEVDRGNIAAARVNVDYTRIVAPFAGRVGLRNIDPGNVVAANGTSGLCVITQLQPITVIFTIAEDSIDAVSEQLKIGTAMPVIALDRSKTRSLATGALLTLDNQVNTATGTVRARATFANSGNELFPNQFVNARLRLKTLTQVDLVPQAAIQRNNDVAFVYVIQPDSTVRSRNVKVLASEGDSAAVTGVDPGDELVTDGFDKLQSGSKIIHRKATPAEANAAQKPG